MSNTTTIIPNPIVFKYQIPVSDIPGNDFKEAIRDNKVLCQINGVRVNNPQYKDVSLDISFKILEKFYLSNPGTSITGKRVITVGEIKKTNVQYKNVTLHFKVNKGLESDILEITNEHEVYNIISNVLKAKGLMDKNETGSIWVYYPKLNPVLSNMKIYLTSMLVNISNFEVMSTIPGDLI